MKDIFLVIASIGTFFYSLRFGYLLTGYPHGGQVLGIPFALLLIILAIWGSYAVRPKLKRVLNIVSFFLFLSIALYSIITEIIISTKVNWFALLYLDNKGISEELFFYIFGLGFLASLTLSIRSFMRKYEENETM